MKCCRPLLLLAFLGLMSLAQAQVFVFQGTFKYTEINDGDTLRFSSKLVLIIDTVFKQIHIWDVSGGTGKKEIYCWELDVDVFTVLGARNVEQLVIYQDLYDEYPWDLGGGLIGDGIYTETLPLTGVLKRFSLGRGLGNARFVRTLSGNLTYLDRVYDPITDDGIVELNWLTQGKVSFRLDAKATAAANNIEIPAAQRFDAAVESQLAALQDKYNVPDSRIDCD